MSTLRPFLTSRWSLVPLLVSGLVLTSSCGDDDDPTRPEDDGILEVPGEFESLHEALEAALSGSTIRIDVMSLRVDSALVIGKGIEGITILGRSDRSGARPILEFDVDGLVAIEVETGASGITLMGFELRGTFRTGALLNGDRSRIEDCRIQGAQRYGVSTTVPAVGVEITENILVEAGLFGVHCLNESSPLVSGNTIVDTGDCGIYTNGAAPTCQRNLIARSANFGIACFGGMEATLDCNDIFLSVTSPYNSGCTPGSSDFYEDPLFCEGDEFTLRADSPCLEVDGCGRVGALGMACDP